MTQNKAKWTKVISKTYNEALQIKMGKTNQIIQENQNKSIASQNEIKCIKWRNYISPWCGIWTIALVDILNISAVAVKLKMKY